LTPAELKELGRISDCVAVVDAEDLELNAASMSEIADPRGDEAKKNLGILRSFAQAAPTGRLRRIVFRFLEAPVKINGAGKVIRDPRAEPPGRATIRTNRGRDIAARLPCDIVFRSVGYGAFRSRRRLRRPDRRHSQSPGPLPDRRRSDGRTVRDRLDRRGPSGIIGTNRADSVERRIDPRRSAQGQSDTEAGRGRLAGRTRRAGVRIVGYGGWQKIDAAERARGQPMGKPREKFTVVPEMIAAIDAGTSEYADSGVSEASEMKHMAPGMHRS
jgi:ferredoxin--NADP+ reductase